MSKIIIKNLNQAKSVLVQELGKLGNPRVAFVGQRASDSKMFSEFLSLDAVICLDYGIDAELLSQTTPLISLEKKIGERRQWYSGELGKIFEDKELRGEILQIMPEGSLMIPYASNPALENFCQSNGLILLGPRNDVRSKFENKLRLVEIKQELGLNNSGEVLSSSSLEFETLRVKFGDEFVVQNENGSSGTGTFFIESKRGFLELAESGSLSEKVVITPKLDGPTLSINGVVTGSQVILMSPAVMVVNQNSLSCKPGVFSGVDFGAPIDAQIHLQVVELAQKVGKKMQSTGFRGAFNLNIMRDDMVLTDINARFMGSGLLSTQLQLANNEVPLSLIHCLQFLGVDFDISPEMVRKIGLPRNGAMMVLHALGGDIQTVRGQLPNFQVVGAVPQNGKAIVPGAPTFSVFSDGSILDSDLGLANFAANFACGLQQSLGLRAP